MSRTTKDLPGWVRSTYWEPRHFWLCESANARYGYHPCDLPSEPVRQAPALRRGRINSGQRCTWWPCWDFPHRVTGGRRRPYVKLGWTGPQRAAVRDECRAVVAEYRASGEVEIVPTVRQARNSVRWDRW